MEIIGIDPGLVHTGVVLMRFLPNAQTFPEKRIEVMHHAFSGCPGMEIRDWIKSSSVLQPDKMLHLTVIEGYRPRSAFNTDARMNAAIHELKGYLPYAQVLDNTGVKKVITDTTMNLLDVWKWTTVTNHQDLRSAARIGLLAMVKDEVGNRILADCIRDGVLRGKPWAVFHLQP